MILNKIKELIGIFGLKNLALIFIFFIFLNSIPLAALLINREDSAQILLEGEKNRVIDLLRENSNSFEEDRAIKHTEEIDDYLKHLASYYNLSYISYRASDKIISSIGTKALCPSPFQFESTDKLNNSQLTTVDFCFYPHPLPLLHLKERLLLLFFILTTFIFLYWFLFREFQIKTMIKEQKHDLSVLLSITDKIKPGEAIQKNDLFDITRYLYKLRKLYEGRPLSNKIEVVFLPDSIAWAIEQIKRTGDFNHVIFSAHFKSLGFSEVNKSEFDGVLRNILKNGASEISENREGSVWVTLLEEESRFSVIISDNGKGISDQIRKRLFTGITTKEAGKGQGIGLKKARQLLRAWGGDIVEVPQINGATFKLTLPKVAPARWFIGKLTIKPGTEVILLDDDKSVTEAIKARFLVHKDRINFVSFLTVATLIHYLENKPKCERLFLVDYFLEGIGTDEKSSFKNGIAVINALGIAKDSILITTAYNDSQVQIEAESLDVRIVPKNYFNSVPIVISPILDQVKDHEKDATGQAPIVAVFIDDEKRYRRDWEESAVRRHLKIETFESVDAFLVSSDRIPKITPIYIDSRLNGLIGENESKKIYKRGYKSIYIQSFNPPSRKKPNHILKIIYGKTPPWESE